MVIELVILKINLYCIRFTCTKEFDFYVSMNGVNGEGEWSPVVTAENVDPKTSL